MEFEETAKPIPNKSRRGEKGIENLKKARLARIEALKKQKEMKENFFNLDSSDSDSDSDEPVLKIKTNKKSVDKNPFESNADMRKEIDMLKNMMLQIASGGKIRKPRPKKEGSQKIIQIMPPAQPVKEEPKKIDENLETHLKRKILNF